MMYVRALSMSLPGFRQASTTAASARVGEEIQVRTGPLCLCEDIREALS